MSALKHGFFRAGFMLCDRCATNTNCPHFTPKSQCLLERQAFEKIVSDLVEDGCMTPSIGLSYGPPVGRRGVQFAF
jgi:hypothetical protein